MAGPAVLFHVQHLLGIGHAKRAALIARALAGAGFRVTVAAGGFPVAGIDYGAARVFQLPPARAADARFTRLVEAGGVPIDEAWMRSRTAMLLALLGETKPDVVMVESFPFARRLFRFELAPLLEAAAGLRPTPLRVCSVRDILVGKPDPAWADDAAALVRRHFDLVLVHGDPDLVPFGATFPQVERIADRLAYTGYVAAPPGGPEAPPGEGVGEVIVSVGGGAVGLPLLDAALGARALGPLAAARGRLLAGPDVAEAELARLRAAAPPGLTIERARPDFPSLLSRCALSVSQAGYNTVLDVLQAGCRAVLVPFAVGGETEQTLRARLLEARGRVAVVEERTLSAERLAAGIAMALSAAPPSRFKVAVDGAERTAALLAERVGRGQRRASSPAASPVGY